MPEKTVLFAEDNPDDVHLTMLAFKEELFPYEVVVARDGQEALDYLFASGSYSGRPREQLPALVLLDLKMPKVGGLEVLEAMRADAALREVAAVVLTTSDEERDREAAARLGARLFLKKPPSFQELRAIVGKLRALIEPG